MYARIMFAVYLGICFCILADGGRLFLSEAEVKSASFQKVLALANQECNKVINHTYWFAEDEDVKGIKQQVAVVRNRNLVFCSFFSRTLTSIAFSKYTCYSSSDLVNL
ncbi:hypothetical protein CSKR_201570 [Clonorchis sinensis]|uniref:Uncharacterized protein n=1 Tax=Clonorchis sinensis TaxID=79923 RepID=A0A8T1MRL6_CLOSI|nr:hypothetical protein CSKR_201570 [Clonorchis sinensis]